MGKEVIDHSPIQFIHLFKTKTMTAHHPNRELMEMILGDQKMTIKHRILEKIQDLGSQLKSK